MSSSCVAKHLFASVFNFLSIRLERTPYKGFICAISSKSYDSDSSESKEKVLIRLLYRTCASAFDFLRNCLYDPNEIFSIILPHIRRVLCVQRRSIIFYCLMFKVSKEDHDLLSILFKTTVNYNDNPDLLIRMYLRPPFCEDHSNIIRLTRISPYSYFFIRSPAIRIRRIQLYLHNRCNKLVVFQNAREIVLFSFSGIAPNLLLISPEKAIKLTCNDVFRKRLSSNRLAHVLPKSQLRR